MAFDRWQRPNADLAAIILVAIPLRKASALQPVDHTGNRTRGQAGRLGELSRGQWTAHDNEVQTLEIGAVDAKAFSHGLAIDHTMAARITHRAIERRDQFVSAHPPG